MEGAAPSDHSGEAPRRVSVLLHSEHPGVNIEISLYIYGENSWPTHRPSLFHGAGRFSCSFSSERATGRSRTYPIAAGWLLPLHWTRRRWNSPERTRPSPLWWNDSPSRAATSTPTISSPTSRPISMSWARCARSMYGRSVHRSGSKSEFFLYRSSPSVHRVHHRYPQG